MNHIFERQSKKQDIMIWILRWAMVGTLYLYFFVYRSTNYKLNLYFIAQMQKMLLYFTLFVLLVAFAQADKNSQLSILSISQSPSSVIRPVVSSVRGGTPIYIKVTGNSLDDDDLSVFVGSFPCLIQSGGVSDSHITCETTDSGSSSDMTGLVVTLVSKGKTYTSSNLDYVNYYNYITPQVTEIFPSSGFAKSVVHFYGSNSISNIGDGKETGDVKSLRIGKGECSMIDVAQSNYNGMLTCIQSSQLQAGKYNITQKLRMGNAQNSPLLRRASLKNEYFEFAHLPTVSSISRESGEEGGQKLEIKGTGFSNSKKNNSVSVDGNNCQIEEVEDNKIKCTLPPRNASSSARLPTNSTNQTNGYFSGAGLNYVRYAGMYSDLASFIQGVRSKNPAWSVEEKGFRAEIREYTYESSWIGETWNGYFTAPVSGVYRFRGLGSISFAMFLSTVEGSTEPAASPLIYSYDPFSEWSNFYYDDIYTAESTVNLTAGKSYYLEAYHANQWNNFFRIAVDVPNTDSSLPFQAYEVHRLETNALVQPEVVVYSFVGGSGGSLNLKLIRTDVYGNIKYNRNVTVQYGCSDSDFLWALNNFDSFSPYVASVVRNNYDSANNLTNSTANISRIDYVVSLYLLRDPSYQQQDFIVTKYNYTGNFTKTVKTQHSPLISGNFSLSIGGVSFSNGSLSYAIGAYELQNYFRTIIGYENVEVQLRTQYGCGYSCVWIISYKGVNAAIPNITLSSARLKGGSSPPTVKMTVRRYYSPHITFDPIDYRFLNTYSNVSSVLVTTNGMPSVCTGICSYQFTKAAVIQSISLSSSTLSLSINNSTKISLSDITVTLNGLPCTIQANSTLSSLKCSIAKNSDGSIPLTAGPTKIEVYIKSIGIIQPASGVTLPFIPLIVSSAASLSGGVNGGSKNTIIGSGFTMNGSLISIVVCNKSATVISSNFTYIQFYMPSCSQSGNQSIMVSIGGVNSSSLIYSYIGATGPLIQSISPTSLNPTLKTTLKVTGSGFGVNQTAVNVFLSNATGKIYRLKVMNFTNSSITVGLPGGEPGIFTVQVTIDGLGDSSPMSAGADQFSYSFTITSVTPNSGSYYGGTLLTINGNNFSPAYSDTLVYVGSTLNWFCSIESITATKILCRTPAISREYQINEAVQVVVSTKLYMLSTCPANNCNFTYVDGSVSPTISSISTTSATTQVISVKGTNFISSSSNTTNTTSNTTNTTNTTSNTTSTNSNSTVCQVILQSAANSSQVYVIAPLYCDNVFANFSAPATTPTGKYNVKIRNSIGESNFKTITIEWTLGSMSPAYASTEGGVVTLVGGSGYPSALNSAYYVTIYNSATNSYYDVNVISCCANNTAQLVVPAAANGSQLQISFVTPSKVYSAYYFAQSYYTPNLTLTSGAIVSSGVNSIVLKRSDSLGGQMISFALVSTINDTNIVTVSNWTTSASNQYTLAVTLAAGSYRILALTSYGYCSVSSTISVTLPANSTITSKPASFAGDTVTIKGQYLSPSSYIQINGFKGYITNYTPTAVTYSVPPISTAAFQTTTTTTFSGSREKRIDSSLLTTFSDQNGTASNSSAVIDGSIKTNYGSSNKVCWIGVDIGANLSMLINKIRYFPSIEWDNVVNNLLAAVFQGSNDMLNWSKLGSADSKIHMGWNTLEVENSLAYRYIRLQHNSTSQCNIAEMEFYGKVFTIVSASPTSQFATVTYKDGYNSLSFSNALEFRQDHTPTVDSVSPSYGDIFGGYQITIRGSYLNFGTQVVLIDSIPCSIVSSNSSQIICTVGARPSYPSSPSFTVTVNGSTAVINNVFQYVLKWSDSRTWGVDLPPVDGDLIYIPAGMTLLVDEDTPNLLGIAAQNATLIFPNDVDITVTTGFITMVGGSFIAGKQSDPLLSNLNIVLTGNYYGKQQPKFGNKGIGCLDCKMSMYGRPRNSTWTTIANTINPGDTNFTVSSSVDWQVGESIVVASTSFFHNESEKATIVAVNNRSITVDVPFANQHVSVVEQYGSDQLVMRAEVGLLSRNIKIKGDNSTAVGQYGPHLMFTSTSFNNLQVQLAYTELSQCGQPQIPGRYCVFFNMAKDLPTSYVRGNSIYSSYARMIALFGTGYLTVEDNVGYQNKGHNIYLQSGTEMHNIIRNNLVISSLSASNMMQTDQSVASFWITHPSNDIYGNHAAGSDYYGINYFINENTAQASDICPYGSPLGSVANNVIHSNMQYGLRILKLYARTYPCKAIKNEYHSDDLWLDNPSIPSVFHNFTIYKNRGEGVWAQLIGNLMFNNFTVAENMGAGIEMEVANFTKEMVSVNNSVIIGQSQLNFYANGTNYTRMFGVVTPRSGQSNLTNVRFYNFPVSTMSIATCSKCDQGQYYTSVGNELFFKQVRFSQIEGQSLIMIGLERDIIYDLDGSLSAYFFNSTQPSGTVVKSFNHIANSNANHCLTSKLSSWNGLVMCDASITIRRIMFTNAIGTYWYGFYSAGMSVLPITNIATVMNSTNINSTMITTIGVNYPSIDKPLSWSLPFVAGSTYQVWWNSNDDFNHLSITTTPMYLPSDPGVVFKMPYKINREMYSVGPMRSYRFPTSADMRVESINNPEPNTCLNGQYHHVNDEGPTRMLAICQSGKNKTRYEYTEINAVYCKYVCPIPPLPALPSSAGIIIKENFIRFWSNASQWPNSTVPRKGEDVYVNGNWTILLDMDPNPARFMIIDGTVIADDTRDIFITAQSIHIRAGSISAGSSSAPFTHKFIIQVNNTESAPGWTIDPLISGNKFLVVTGSLNLYGVSPATTSTYLTQTAFSGSTSIFVANKDGWAVGDSIVLSPSLGHYDESELVIISSMNTTDGSITISSPLKFTHYGSTSYVSSSHGTIDVNTQVGHLDRNIKILSGPSTSYGLEFLVYSYNDNKMRWTGSIVLSGVQISGISRLQFLNVISGSSTISQSSFANCLTSFVNVRSSNQISFTNNVFFRSSGSGVSASKFKSFTFTSNLIMGVMGGGCFYTEDYINPATSGISIKNNFCLGASHYGYAFPLIRCNELQTNPMANNTAGSCSVGFVFNGISSITKCKAFSYIKAYACKIGQIANPIDTNKLIYQHFVLADNQRGATLSYSDGSDDTEHVAEFSYSYITALSRPACDYCYGSGISCSNSIGVQLLSVSTNGRTFPYYDYASFDDITSPEVFDSKAYLTKVTFDNFKSNYSLAQCQNNYIFRPHRHAYDAVAQHSLFDCSCSNCDDVSYLLADPNDPSTLGWSGGCGDMVCTGKSNYLIVDWNGTVFGSIGTLIPDNSVIGSNELNCTYVPRMNAHFCRRTDFAMLGFESTAPDFNSRIMWPATLNYSGSNYSTAVNGWRQWDWSNNVPQNHRIGRFLSIVKLNSIYNITFKSMPPINMNFQLEKRTPLGNQSNYVIVKLKYPVPNLIRISANNEVVDPILLTDAGLRRNINASICGDNIYFYTNYTTNFVVTEGNCLISLELVETVQLTTHFAMDPNQFFTNTVMSSFIDNLCALLGVTDTSRVKIVGVYTGSTIVQTMITPPNTNNSTNSTNSTSNSTNATSSSVVLNDTEPSLAAIQQTLSALIQNGSYSGSMTVATGYQVITSSSALYEVPNTSSSSSDSSSKSTGLLIGIVVGVSVAIIFMIIVIIQCVRKKSVGEEVEEEVCQEKEIPVPSDSIVFSNEEFEVKQEKSVEIVRENKNRKNRITNKMRNNRRLARNSNNNNLQVRESNKDYFDFDE